MKRYEMVKSHEEFNEIINKGNRLKGKYAYIFSKEKEFDKPNFGIAVGKKLGNAVVRNKFKRQFRNIVDKNRFLFKNNNNYIIMIKREANNASFSELETDLINTLKKGNS
ncbi:ribonuclease P protein component [bacterium]|jgi:ribonuclease P protein component|nr:ribonuclease P protein component [bacterium]